MQSESFSKGGYLVRIVSHPKTHISLSYTVRNREIFERRIVPNVWGLVPLGHVNFPPIFHWAPGIGGIVYH